MNHVRKVIPPGDEHVLTLSHVRNVIFPGNEHVLTLSHVRNVISPGNKYVLTLSHVRNVISPGTDLMPGPHLIISSQLNIVFSSARETEYLLPSVHTGGDTTLCDCL